MVIERVLSRRWPTDSIGKAVGISIENFIRHEMTDYDRRLKAGEDRKALRKALREEIDVVASSWRAKPTA